MTATNWRGRDITTKGRGPGPNHTKTALASAREDWESGRLAFVYKPADLGTLNPGSLADALDGIMRIGWQLHPAAVGDAQLALFVFNRPAAPP